MASNFNNSTLVFGTTDDRVRFPNAESDSAAAAPVEPAPAAPAAKPGEGPVTSDRPESAAFVRFRSCRWMQPAENGNQEFCTHREVKPYAGTQGFDPDAWCPECQYYKLRRAPKKRNPADDYSY
ncbi:MAG: hypothetical protein DMF87_14150 [Acidobacteria bacterium]|nr:MAG: hypothetical protein DMF88_21695 [Acidobacteriota bacterium]PYR78470.1 MAG: hypothetical protein DMF87_14150 [Acidobacteriota bacterium]